MTMRGSRDRNARARALDDAALHAAVVDAFAAARAANRAAADADAWLHSLRVERDRRSRERKHARRVADAIQIFEAIED